MNKTVNKLIFLKSGSLNDVMLSKFRLQYVIIIIVRNFSNIVSLLMNTSYYVKKKNF